MLCHKHYNICYNLSINSNDNTSINSNDNTCNNTSNDNSNDNKTSNNNKHDICYIIWTNPWRAEAPAYLVHYNIVNLYAITYNLLQFIIIYVITWRAEAIVYFWDECYYI